MLPADPGADRGLPSEDVHLSGAASQRSVIYNTDAGALCAHNLRSKAVGRFTAEERAALREFQVFVTDDRYTVPSLYIVEATSAARACELAEAIFTQSLHHIGIEVFDDGDCILTRGVVEQAPRASTRPEPGRPRRPRT